MPFVSNSTTEDEQKNPAQGPITPSGTTGIQVAPSGGVGSVGAPSQTGQPQTGGAFATLDKYLAANQGQAEPLAGKITQGINQQYNMLGGQTSATLSDIGRQVANAPGYTASNPNILAQEAANPVSFASDQGNVKQFQGLLNNAYGGPLSAESTPEYTKQQNTINQAIATGQQQTGSEAGRKQLLEGVEAAPSTSVTGLNAAILSQNPSAQAQIESAYKPFSSLLTDLQSGAQDVNKTIAKEQADAASSSQAANKAIADQVAGVNTNVQSALNAAKQKNQQFVGNYNDIVGKLTHTENRLSDEQAAMLGITPQQAAALAEQGALANAGQYMTAPNFGVVSQQSDINSNAFLTPQTAPADVTAAQVATPEQFAFAKALQALNNGQVPATALIDPSQAALAGTYKAPTLQGTFDYNKALENAATVEQQERANALAQAQGMSAAAQAQHDSGGGFWDSPFGSLAKYFANPILTVPQEIKGAKKLAGKI